MSDLRNCFRSGALVLVATLLFGCVTVPKRVAQTLQQAERHNRKGIVSRTGNNIADSGSEFAEAYRLYASVENYQGMVTALVNGSRLYRTSGQLDRAGALTDLALVHLANTPELASEVFFEKAKLSLLAGRVDDAATWGEKALTAASDADRPRMLNLSAGISRTKGLAAQSGLFAEEALKGSRKTGDRREEANALRLLGELELHEKRYQAAVERFMPALEIDKELALSGKISEDLLALSRTFEAMGDSREAALYLQRAVEVFLARDDREQAASALEKLGLLKAHGSRGDAGALHEPLSGARQEIK